ncbi:Elicitin-like protein, partial [Globisporangium splendens]
MQLSIVAIAATLAVANAQTACDLTRITPLLTNPNVQTCTADSGFNFVPPSRPTADTLTRICASTACLNVVSAVQALNLGDCTLLGLQLETDLLTPITTACSGTSATAGSSAAAAGSSAGSSGGTATVGSTSGTTTTTTAPAPATTSSSSGSSTSSTTVTTTPAPTTATPASSASSLAMAAGSVAVAVAAAFF